MRVAAASAVPAAVFGAAGVIWPDRRSLRQVRADEPRDLLRARFRVAPEAIYYGPDAPWGAEVAATLSPGRMLTTWLPMAGIGGRRWLPTCAAERFGGASGLIVQVRAELRLMPGPPVGGLRAHFCA